MTPTPPPRSSYSRLLRRWLVPAGIVLLILFAVLLPRQIDQQSVWNLFFLICLGISIGQSWNILGGFAGQTSLGHAAFFGLGALITRTLWFAGTPFILAFGLAGLTAVAFAMVIGVPTFRLRGAYFAIGTLAVAEGLRITVGQNAPYISTMSGRLIASYNLPARYYLALGLALAASGAAYLLLRSRWSLGILALREDEEAAQATGVPVFRHKLLALAVSSLFMGLAGGVFAYQQISYYPAAPFSPVWTFDALLISFIGGLGTLVGPVVGAIFFVVVRERLAANLTDVHQVIFGALFIVIVLIFPGGLVEVWDRLGKRVRRR